MYLVSSLCLGGEERVRRGKRRQCASRPRNQGDLLRIKRTRGTSVQARCLPAIPSKHLVPRGAAGGGGGGGGGGGRRIIP